MENSESEKLVTAPGFKEDCGRILETFRNSDDRSFQGFCEVWKMMKFSHVYWNRVTEAEMLGFCEEALNIAKGFISPSGNQIQRIGGVFLLYGLYFKCPIKSLKIRLTMTEWENLLKLRDDLFRNEKFEAVYVLNKLIESHAFAFCISEQERGLENYYVLKDVMKINPKNDSSSKKSEEIAATLSEISKMSESYIERKLELTQNSTGAVPKLYDELKMQRLLSTMESIDSGEGGKSERPDFLPIGYDDDDDDDEDGDYDPDLEQFN